MIILESTNFIWIMVADPKIFIKYIFDNSTYPFVYDM
jgi:hypothetical protein